MTTEPDPPPGRTVDWGAIGLSALGVLSAWLAATGLSPTVRAMSARAPLVEFHPAALIPAPLAISLFALASIALIPRRQAGPGRAVHGVMPTRRSGAARRGSSTSQQQAP